MMLVKANEESHRPPLEPQVSATTTTTTSSTVGVSVDADADGDPHVDAGDQTSMMVYPSST